MQIYEDIETLVQFVERWNKKDEDRKAAQAAQNVEVWLATAAPKPREE